MKEEILTAKEWLDENFMDIYFTCGEIWVDRMERYANYRTKMLEEKFSKHWKETTMKILELEGKIKFIESLKIN